MLAIFKSFLENIIAFLRHLSRIHNYIIFRIAFVIFICLLFSSFHLCKSLKHSGQKQALFPSIITACFEKVSTHANPKKSKRQISLWVKPTNTYRHENGALKSSLSSVQQLTRKTLSSIYRLKLS